MFAPLKAGDRQPARVKPDLPDHATLEVERFIRGRQWMWLFMGLGIVACIPLDAVLDTPLMVVVPLQVVMAGLYLGVAKVSATAPIRRLRQLILACGVALSLCIVGSTAISGGHDSPMMLVLLVVPLVFAMMMPIEPNATLAVALTNMVAGSLMYVGLGRGLIVWGLLSAVMGGFAWLFARHERQRMISQIQRAVDQGRLSQLLDESEQRRARSEKLAILGQLSASIAHEINNPLAYARTNLKFAYEELTAANVDPEVKSALFESMTGLGRVDQVIKDLKGLSHDAPVKKVPVEVARFVTPAVRIAQIRAGTQVKLEIGDVSNLPHVLAHEGRLTQVLVNLLVNAIDAVEGIKGCVKLLVSVEKGQVRFTVQDNGPGIAPEVLPRLFNAHITTKELGKGTGMGLMLCHEYVTHSGGTLTAANNASGGARFDVTLPTAA